MAKEHQYGTIEQALEDLRQGKIILVTDDPDRENEGDMICAGQFATQENINFMAVHARGLICTPMSAVGRGAAGTAADGIGEHRQPRDRLYRFGRSHRYDDRNFREGARYTIMKCADPEHEADGSAPAGPHIPARRALRRSSRPQRPHRGDDGSAAPRGTDRVRRLLRGHGGGRHDDAHAEALGARGKARPDLHHHQGAAGLSPHP
jgi:hypothetical protein